jgi:hypothetical protein
MRGGRTLSLVSAYSLVTVRIRVSCGDNTVTAMPLTVYAVACCSEKRPYNGSSITKEEFSDRDGGVESYYA